MKKNFVLFVTIFLSVTTVIINAQSIWFLNPTNGETVTGTGSQTTVYMQLQFNYNLSGSQYDHYIKLFRPPYSTQQSGQGGGITFDYDLPIGTYTWRLELWECYVGQGCLKVAEQTVTFYVKHKMWVSNNFLGGDIKIDNQTVPSGTETYKLTGSNLLVGAIDQPYGDYYYVWNQSGVNNSEWQKKLWAQTYLPINGGTPRDFPYTVVSNDNGAAIRGMLKKRYTISRDDQTDAGIFTNQQTFYIVEENSDQISAPSTKIINSKTYNFIGWKDNLEAPNPRTITPTDNETYTAVYKSPQLSNDANAYKYNNQRKFLRTPDGNLHSTYQSMNGVWYELSTDNGQTWQLKDYSIQADPTWIESEPSISYYVNSSNQTIIIIVWRLQRGLPEDWIRMRVYVYDSVYGLIDTDEQDIHTDNPEMLTRERTSPVVTCAPNGKTLVVWESKNSGTQEGFYYSYGERLSNGNWQWYQTSQWLECTSLGALSPALYASNIGSFLKFHLAWVQNNKIYYCCIYPNLDNELEYDPQNIEVSERSGYTIHSRPTITSADFVSGPTRYEYLKFAWIGYRDAYIDDPCAFSTGESRVLYRSKAPTYWSPIYVFGSNANSVNINKGATVMNYYEPFACAWSEGNNCNYPNKYFRSHDQGTQIRTLNTTGSELQLNNSTDFTTMYANSFHRNSFPYFFSLSSNLSGQMEKTEAIEIFKGREGVVTKNNVGFYYAVGDITINGDIIDFIEFPDSINVNNLQTMNEFLQTKPFNVNSSSTLTYGVQYGITDSSEAVVALSDSSEITSRVDLIDHLTGEVLGVFDEVSYTAANVFQYENIGYQVDLSGIGTRTVVLKLVTSTEATCAYSITNRYSDTEALNKNGHKQITFKENSLVTEYALEQNYPNPFNPATVIKYQIPKAGNVMLKVYDILGGEVATLVNEFQNEGRYEVNFNASSLAGGVYLYSIQVNDFINVKKMILMK